MQVQQQMEILEESKSEIDKAKDALVSLKSIPKGTKMYAPVAGGIFVEAKAEETGSFLITVGNNIVVRKSGEEIQDLLVKQIHEVAQLQQELYQSLQKLAMKGAVLEQGLNRG